MQQSVDLSGAASAVLSILIVVLPSLGFLALWLASLWKLFVKAGEPGWAAVVPIYNLVVALKIAGRPTWMIVLFFFPLLNFVGAVLLCLGIAERFGKTPLYGVGLLFLGFVFFPLLAFSDAKYAAP